MHKNVTIFVLSIILVVQSGCATVVSGKTQDVMIRSTPTGATVFIDEMAYGTTPLVAKLIRKKRHTIQLKKEGYGEVTRVTTRGFNGWYLGNIILGGLIGLIVDPITGAMYDIKPEEINVTMPPPGQIDVVEGEKG